MGTVMTESRWGERKVQKREARRRGLGLWMMAAAIAIACTGRFVAGLVAGWSGRPTAAFTSRVEAVLTAIALLAAMTVLGWRAWRLLDEVERQELLVWLAATGIAGIAARPLLLITQPALGLADPQAAAWYVAALAGVAVTLVRRWSRISAE